MTQLALNLAGYINGVARRHAETTRQMFPGYRVHASHQRRSCRALDTFLLRAPVYGQLAAVDSRTGNPGSRAATFRQ